jgi:hypothetical protein
MTRRFTSLFLAGALALAPFSLVSAAARNNTCSSGLSIPIQATSTDQGSFTGALEIRKFAAVDKQLVALGTLTGTLTDENGVTSGIVRNVALPVVLPGGGTATAAGGVETQAICPILNLVLGPLHLNLLGLIIDLNEVHLDITADSEGGLLGSLLCGVAGLLGGSTPLEQVLNQLVGLLNQILAILG